MSQRAAAEALRISQALLSHYETGAREPGLPFIVRVCDFYGVSADYLLGRTLVRDSAAALDPEEVYDAQSEKDNRLGRASASSMLGRKMVVNAICVLFDLAGRSGSTELTAELTNYFGGAVYKMFRHFCVQSDADGFFSVPGSVCGAASAADMARSEARFLTVLHRKDDPPRLPGVTNDTLYEEYPQLVRSLLTLTHQAGSRAAKYLP